MLTLDCVSFRSIGVCFSYKVFPVRRRSNPDQTIIGVFRARGGLDGNGAQRRATLGCHHSSPAGCVSLSAGSALHPSSLPVQHQCDFVAGVLIQSCCERVHRLPEPRSRVPGPAGFNLWTQPRPGRIYCREHLACNALLALLCDGVLGISPYRCECFLLACALLASAAWAPTNICPRLLWRLSPYSGIRVGEASLPGPPRQCTLHSFFCGSATPTPESRRAAPSRKDECIFAVVNPTSILHKVPLCLQTQADVFFLSETSAVHRTQQVTTREFQKYGFKAHWGSPVPSHQPAGASAQPGLRGFAAGVAVVSRVPSRASRPGLPQDDVATCRLSEAFVRVGALEVRLLCIYGYTSARPDAREETEALLSRALHRVTQNAVPAIIAGDFNMPPGDLPSGQALLQLGYREVFSLASATTGRELPPTCKNSTRHDTALLHPSLVPLWRRAWVLSDLQLFDAHAPLCFSLQACCQRPCKKLWTLPRPWSDLGPDKLAVERAFEPKSHALYRQAAACTSIAEIDQVLQDFSFAAEEAVSEALASKHAEDPLRQPYHNLPKAFRGRCRPLPMVRRELPCVARPAREGEYTPDTEACSTLARLRVRQVRRVSNGPSRSPKV